MIYIMVQIYRQLRWALPCWTVQFITDWLPDNSVTVRVRGWLLSFFIRECGKNFQCGRRVILLNTDRLELGDSVYIATGTWLNAMGKITIASEVVIAPYVVISSSVHGFKDGSVRFGGAHPSPVIIGKGTWLASHSCVRAGVEVGAGVLVAANAFVAKNTGDHVIVGGVPAKVIKEREDNPSSITSSLEINFDS